MERWFHTCIWTALIIASVVILWPKPDQNALVDFGSVWSATRLLIRGENPYDAQALLENEKAAGWDMTAPVIPWNPPWALSIVIPFALMQFNYAKWCWLLLNCVLVLGLADYWWRVHGGPREHRMAAWLAALWFFPCIVAVYFGQLSLLVLAGVTGVEWSLKRDRPGALGFFVFLASLKPHLLVPFWLFFFVFWVFQQRHSRRWIWAASSVITANIVVVALRPSLYLNYVMAASSAHGPAIWATPTVGTVLRVVFSGAPKWVVFLPGICGLLISLILWAKWSRDFNWERHLDMILLLSFVTASYAWIFDWALLLPIAIRILVWFQANPARQWPAMAGLVCVMLAFVWEQAHGLFPLGAVWFPAGMALVYAWARWKQDWLDVLSMRSRAEVAAQRAN